MQQQMNFLQTPPPPDPARVWTTLDEPQRTEILMRLARLIVKVAAASMEGSAIVDRMEADDE